MTWQREIDELRRREALAREMGGPDKVKRHRDAGKLTVRERVDGVLDPGSFHEIGALTGVADYGADGALNSIRPTNFVFGRGRIDGRPVIVEGDDFTIRGGSADASIWDKMVAAEQMANELRLPLVRLCDGTGGGGSVKSLETDGRTYVSQAFGWNYVTDNLGTVPVVGLGLGSVAGGSAPRAWSPATIPCWCATPRSCSSPGRRWSRASPRRSTRKPWATPTCTRPAAPSTTRSTASRKPSS